MLNYYYHPIFGLQYKDLGQTLIIDISKIPKDFSVEDFIGKWKKMASELGMDFGNAEQILHITDYQL